MIVARILRAGALSALALGCVDGPTTPTQPLPPGFEALYGRWAWVLSCCGIAGNRSTPESTGTTILLAFERPDSLHAYRNEALWWSTTFAVRLVRQQDQTVAVLHTASGQGSGEIRLRADTLEFIRTCADCPSDRFQRAPGAGLLASRRLRSR